MTENADCVTVYIGLVKQIILDNIIVQGQYEKGKNVPFEKRLGFSNITIPKTGLPARVLPNGTEVEETADEPWAFEAREFLRKALVGRTIYFIIDYVVPGSNRELASIYANRKLTVNIAEVLVANGLAIVRDGPSSDEALQRLLKLEARAKEAHNGRWSGKSCVRHDIKWSVDVDSFLQEHKNETLEGVVEHVRDGNNLRIQILPLHAYINLTLSGISCPAVLTSSGASNPVYNEAKIFTECRVLQQDVKVILHSSNGQNGFYGSMLHKFGDIAVHLLGHGLAQICEWNLKCVKDPTLYRNAEALAKENNLGIWKDYSAQDAAPPSTVQYTAHVVAINGGDSLQVRKDKEENVEVIHFSSIRPPRVNSKEKINYPLFDIPYYYEARECLRKLIGKKVSVTVDYKSTVTGPSPNAGQKRTCCTVLDGNKNVAVSLVEQGLATVVRYRMDDDKRSPYYSELLEAENHARTNGLGVHSKADPVPMRVIELTGDVAKSHLPLLRQAGRIKAIVEWVMSGSRFRLFVPSQNLLFSFALSYINCPRTSITVKPGTSNVRQSEPFGDEAYKYVKDLCFQRDVSIVIEALDRSNCFTGILYTNPNSKSDDSNLAVCLLKKGLSKIHAPSAQRGPIYRQLHDAVEAAKINRIGVWSIEESDDEEDETEEAPLVLPSHSVYISNVQDTDLHVFVQFENLIERTLELINELKEKLSNSSYDPEMKLRKNLLVAANLPDDGWARAQIKAIGDTEITVFAIDYGKFYTVERKDLRALPPGQCSSMRPVAKEVVLAFVKPALDEDIIAEAIQLLCDYSNKCSTFEMKTYYRMNELEYVTLTASADIDLNKELLSNGLVVLAKENQIPVRYRNCELYESYKEAENSARNARLNAWRYGNCGYDEIDY